MAEQDAWISVMGKRSSNVCTTGGRTPAPGMMTIRPAASSDNRAKVSMPSSAERAPGGQNSRETQRDSGLQGFIHVGNNVDRPVQRHIEPVGVAAQLFEQGNIERAIAKRGTEHHAGKPAARAASISRFITSASSRVNTKSPARGLIITLTGRA